MKVGFHSLKLTFTWLLVFSGMEQLKEAHCRFWQLCTTKHSVGQPIGLR